MAGGKKEQLERIAKKIKACRICRENKIGVAVPGEGDPDARVLFVGEAPGKQEAVSGRPFIGRAGKLLRQLIEETGLAEEDIFITSAVKYLPEHTTPTKEEIEHGRQHLFKQIEVIDPEVIVILGRTAGYAILDRKVEIAREHGSIIEQGGKKYLLAYHPAAPLYSPKIKAEISKDFVKLKKILKSQAG